MTEPTDVSIPDHRYERLLDQLLNPDTALRRMLGDRREALKLVLAEHGIAPASAHSEMA